MVSGGEPLLRKDLIDILQAIKKQGKARHMVLTTHGALLNRKKYESIREAGVDLISLSFDYPDERHDEFRGIPGLFNKIVGFLEDIQDVQDKGIAFSTVVQRDNYKDLPKIAELARTFGIQMNMSTYTWLRTQKKEYMIPPEELPELKAIIQQLRDFKKRHNTVIASEFGFKRMIEFFERGSLGNCRAGRRFLIINPDATLSPCGLIMGDFQTRRELINDFSKNNDCGYCATSIRVNCEKTFPYYVMDVLIFLYGSFFPKRQKAH
jgi:MoaA/NifB/PqqE/SkfB family radical SAM enzyme